MSHFLLLAALFPAFAFAAQIHLAVAYPVINTQADSNPDAVYYRRHSTTSIIGAVGYGFQLSEAFVDVRYEYWISDRKFDLNSETYSHRLNYQTVGFDIGYSFGHQRVWWAFTLGVHYPIVASSGTFTASREFQYQMRAMLAIRVAGKTWLHLEGGQRLANLGVFADGVTPYVFNGAAFDLSGPFLSLGTAFHF